MVALGAATIVLALGISTITIGAAFLAWWYYDQRKDWVVELHPGEGTVRVTKRQADRNELTGTWAGDDYRAPLEPDKSYYRKGWRSGRLLFVDVQQGVQTDPAANVDRAVGYDLARIVDAKIGETWRQNFPDESFGEAIKDFLATYGPWIVLGLIGLAIYMITGGNPATGG
jgi:hypothetical protein